MNLNKVSSKYNKIKSEFLDLSPTDYYEKMKILVNIDKLYTILEIVTSELRMDVEINKTYSNFIKLEIDNMNFIFIMYENGSILIFKEKENDIKKHIDYRLINEYTLENNFANEFKTDLFKIMTGDYNGILSVELSFSTSYVYEEGFFKTAKISGIISASQE